MCIRDRHHRRDYCQTFFARHISPTLALVAHSPRTLSPQHNWPLGRRSCHSRVERWLLRNDTAQPTPRSLHAEPCSAPAEVPFFGSKAPFAPRTPVWRAAFQGPRTTLVSLLFPRAGYAGESSELLPVTPHAAIPRNRFAFEGGGFLVLLQLFSAYSREAAF